MNELIWLLLLLLAIFFILYIPLLMRIPELPNLENVSFSTNVRGCAQGTNRMIPRAISSGELKTTITTEGNKIVYYKTLNHLCCRMVMINRKLEGWVINIYENWSGLGCRCTCFSEINTTVENLPKGTYTVKVYEGGINIDGTQMVEKLIISKIVKI